MKTFLILIIGIIIIFVGVYFVELNNENTAITNKKYLHEFTEQDIKELETMMFELTNEKRIANNVPPLEIDLQLYLLAKEKSQDMITSNYFDHANLDGLTTQDIASSMGYKCEKEYEGIIYEGVSENISLGNPDPDFTYSLEELSDGAINGLTNSPEHKENLLKPYKDKIGIGISLNQDHLYTTQIFC